MRQRAVKSAWEVERIRAAAAVADEVCARVPGILREGLTEAEFAGRVEAEARRLGHEGVIRMRGFNQEMFYGQLLTGVSGGVPSYLDTPLAGTGLSPAVAQGVSFRRIGRGEPVVFDFVPGARRLHRPTSRACSRSGRCRRELVRAYDAALRDPGGGDRRGAGPGVTCRAVYETRARRPRPTQGWPATSWATAPARCASSATASGIELDELPVLIANDLELEPGMVFALEPKFVLPGPRRDRHREHVGGHRDERSSGSRGARAHPLA